MKVYRFSLYNTDNDDHVMSTEVDEFNPFVDLEFHTRFQQGDCYIVFNGEAEEPDQPSDFDLLAMACDLLDSADVVQEFEDSVWLKVPRTEWENYREAFHNEHFS